MDIKENQYVTAPTAANLAGMTVRNFHYLRAAGKTPKPLALGNRFYYLREEIERWVEGRQKHDQEA